MTSVASRAVRPTVRDELDRAVDAVRRQKDRWPQVATRVRIELLQRCIEGTAAVADDMAAAGCRAKGLDPDSPAGAEEWFSGPLPVIRNLRLLVQTLRSLERGWHPRMSPPRAWRPPDKLISVSVFPRDVFDRLLYPGVRIDVWLKAAAPRLIPRTPRGGVVLVLGAGNVASIGLMDLLDKLFVENRVVVLKMHPINEYLGASVERAFRPLIDNDYLRIVYGDAATGQYLVRHPDVDEIHLTGSVEVHNRIARLTHKPITSELGCVTPVIVTPGEWTDDELTYQAENVATMVALNASCNCNAAKVIVTWRGWRQREEFLQRIRNILTALPARLAYYPESAARYARFLDRPVAAASHLPFVMISDVDPSRRDALVFNQEAWSPVVAETGLAADDAEQFLDAAVEFCNDHIAGTLSCVVLVDPRARRHLTVGLARAVRELRYGTVAINQWSAVSYALAAAPWGAYPGHTRDNVGSGIGVVHNTQMLDAVIKTVLDGPFITRVKPPWFVTHRRAHEVAQRMARFEASPAWWQVPALAWAAYRA